MHDQHLEYIAFLPTLICRVQIYHIRPLKTHKITEMDQSYIIHDSASYIPLIYT